jgi:hypothetical protein
MFNFLKIFSIALSIFIISLFANAQIPGLDNVIVLNVSPKYPKPGQLVIVSAESFSIDLDRAESIVWYVNGKVIARGIDIKEVQFEAGKLGSSSVVEVAVRTSNGGTFSQDIIIRPTEVDLIWEAETYTPPFYKGKALPSSNADVRVVAMPHFVADSGVKLLRSDLVFTWKVDGKILGNVSGRGKDSITIEGPQIFRAKIVEVEISSIGNSLQGKGIIGISSVEPKIVFYENNPILGMKYENAVRESILLSQDEMTITAHPYFFSSKRRIGSGLEYSWNVDGSSVNSLPDDDSSITFRQVGDGEGEADISLSIHSMNKILQSARESFLLLFGFRESSESAPFEF